MLGGQSRYPLPGSGPGCLPLIAAWTRPRAGVPGVPGFSVRCCGWRGDRYGPSPLSAAPWIGAWRGQSLETIVVIFMSRQWGLGGRGALLQCSRLKKEWEPPEASTALEVPFSLCSWEVDGVTVSVRPPCS